MTKRVFQIAAAAMTALLLPQTASADDTYLPSCDPSNSEFTGEIVTLHGKETSYIRINADGTYPKNSEPVTEMTAAYFSCPNQSQPIFVVDRLQAKEDLLLHQAINNPSPELIAYMIESNPYINTAADALKHLQEMQDVMIPQMQLQHAFNAFSQTFCPAAEVELLMGLAAAGFLRISGKNEIPLDEDLLQLDVLCPTSS